MQPNPHSGGSLGSHFDILPGEESITIKESPAQPRKAIVSLLWDCAREISVEKLLWRDSVMYQEPVRAREGGPCPSLPQSFQELWDIKGQSIPALCASRKKERFYQGAEGTDEANGEWNERSFEGQKFK